MPMVTRERLLDRISPVFGREEQLDALEKALDDAADPAKHKQIVLLYGQSGLAKTQLLELAFGVYNQNQNDVRSFKHQLTHSQSGGRRTSAITAVSNGSGGSSGGVVSCGQQAQYYPRRRHPPSPCWYCYGKFTELQEAKPYAELSRSIAELILSQLLPEMERLNRISNMATRSLTASSLSDHDRRLTVEPIATGEDNASKNSNLSDSVKSGDMKSVLRERLTATDFEILIKFCPEVEQLHLYSARERAIEQTKRAAKAARQSAETVTKLVGKGVAMVTPTFQRISNTRLSNPDNKNNGTREASASEIDQRTKPITSRFDPLERLKYAVKLFFRALSTLRPIVCVMDDLQYATKDGTSSLLFLESLLCDPELHQFLFCGVIRSDVGARAERKALAAWTDSLSPDIIHLKMSRMKEEHVRAMLMNLLQLEDDDLGPLSSLVHQRTGGSDYFVFELINFLQNEGILYLSPHTFRWTVDVDEARRKTMISENVLSFVGRRLLRLPLPVQRCLKIAAFLGYRFDEDLLAKIMKATFIQRNKDMQDIKDIDAVIDDLLQTAVKEGFIERLSHQNVETYSRFKFVHVEIQTACERLNEDSAILPINQLHWNVGAALWRGWRNNEDYGGVENRVLFPCVKELNEGRNAYKFRKETLDQLVRLNHEAAKRSFALHAFFPAASYLETAVRLAGPSSWLENYELTLELYTFLARMYLASGQLRKIPKVVRIVGEWATSFHDRFPVDLVELYRCKMEGEVQKHIQQSISLLNCLGVSLSGNYFWFQAEEKKRRVKEALMSVTDEEIRQTSTAPGSTDESIELIEYGLIHSLMSSFEDHHQLEEEYPNVALAVACKMVEAFIRERNPPQRSAICLTMAACLFCESDYDSKFWTRFLKKLTCAKDQSDLSFSIRLAELALTLPYAENELETIGVVGLVRHWRHPLPNCAEHMMKGYNLGMQGGDLRMASSAAWGYVQMYFFSGLPLAFLVKDVESILNVMTDYSQKFEATRIFPVYQLILNLTGQSKDILNLQNGAAMDRAAKIGWVSCRTNLDAALMLYLHCQEFTLATAVMKELETTVAGMLRFHVSWHIRVHGLALVAIQNAKKRGFNSRKWRKKARKYVAMVQTWVDDAKAINMGHKLKLLQCEMMTLKRPYPSDADLIAAYDEAIVRSARSGFRQDAALAAAFASRAVREKFEKQKYARRSQEFYASWDAFGVVSHLRKRSRVFRFSCDEAFTRLSSSGQGVQGRERFLDENGILLAHRSITAAEEIQEKEALTAARQEKNSVFSV